MKDFTEGNEARLILQFSIPLVLGNIFQNLYNIVDSVIVGNFLGKEALGAVGASFPIIFTLISMVIGIGSGASTVISQFFGAKQVDQVRRTIDTIFTFFLFASILVTLIGILCSKSIFLLLQLPDEMLPEAVTYLNIYLTGMFFFFGFAGISSILRGMGDAKTPLWFMILSTVVNIFFDLLFVVVFKWGIEGVAFATVVAQAIAFFSATWYLNKKHPVINLSFRKYIFDREIFKSCVKIGLPTGFQQSFIAFGMMAIMGIVNTFGTNAVAAYTAAMRVDSFAKMPALTFSSALSSFVGQNLGAFQEKRARKGLKITIGFSLAYAVFISIIIIVFGKYIIQIFTPDQHVIAIGQDYLVIVSSFYLLLSIMFSLTGFLRGAGATFIPMLTTLLSLYLVRIPLAFWLSGKIGVNGIWWAEPAGWFIGMVILIVYYFTGRWKGRVVVKSPKK
ncbi:MATE family efflux transporter [Mangrovibacterium diazotrophicum]|uniref:Multidrug-efflux transporter n=1 Tax=Mangrovibacterium diazotrophicum TaxID=1261403 RepID=A0A419VXF7_9BACT|nr:MATE family efflux transporter [Mangrovibacterium diazotrophicum]RKD87915.1 putative MATE family efflux protein [Mangrovibacterium diazotrophicum]